jgi:hypothetical protein
MTGLEPLVVGYLAAWVARKARRVGDRVDRALDDALDARVDRLCDLVVRKLGGEPALTQLEQEVAEGVDNERTKVRLQLAVEDAAERDPSFADELRVLVEQIRSEPSGIVINAKAEGNAQMPVQGSGTMYNTFGR